jgi:hypothetical protein
MAVQAEERRLGCDVVHHTPPTREDWDRGLL